MRKFYQKEWHGIDFKEIDIKLSKDKFPDQIFYQKFYKKFEERYHSVDQLEVKWLNLKKKAACSIKEMIKQNVNISILSLGAGLGVIEKELIKEGINNIDIQDVSEESVKFIKDYINPDNIYIGVVPECIPKDKKYDIIIAAGIEYCFNNNEFFDLIKSANFFLKDNGSLILLSWSHYSRNIINTSKSYFKRLLVKLNLIDPGQLWGYLRTKNELTFLLEKSSLKITNIILDKTYPRWPTLIIKSKKS